MKKAILNTVLSLVLLLVCGLAYSILRFFIRGDVISKQAATYNTLCLWTSAVDEHYSKTGHIADGLNALKNVKNIDYVDAWGYSVIYRKYQDGMVLLGSLGSDGKKGGGGQESDIFISADPREMELSRMCVDGIPESVNTRSKLQYLKKQILGYHTSYGQLPEDLNQLELNHEYLTNDIRDYWNEPIVYEQSSSFVELRCHRMNREKKELIQVDCVLRFQVPSAQNEFGE